MKKILLLITGCISCYHSNAQQIYYSQNFESFPGYQLTGWSNQLSAYAYPWSTGLAYLIGGCFVPPTNNTRVAGITDTYTPQQSPIPCMASHVDSNVFVYSPPIMLPDTGLVLSYDSYFLETQQNGKKEAARVEVSIDNGNNWLLLQQVPPNDPHDFARYYLPLSMINGAGTIRLGFRYSDSAQHMSGWMIDNISIFKPLHKDLSIVSISPTDSMRGFIETGHSVQHDITVFNYGLDTVTSFIVNYQLGNGTVHTYNVTGVQIPSFTSYTFTDPVPDTISTIGKQQLTAWVDMPGDAIYHNDTVSSFLYGTAFTPVKRLVIEEGTGTWCSYGPRGLVFMNQANTSDLNIALVSVHTVDPMMLQDYSDVLLYIHWNFVPYFLFDRRQNIAPEHFFEELGKQKDYFGFADIKLGGSITGNNLTVNADIIPAIDLTGDNRLALIITESNINGTDSDYAQRNIFTNNQLGPMGGYESKPDPVPASDMHYNFVARQAFPSAEGVPGMLPDTMHYNQAYHYTFHTTLDPSWNKSNLKAYVFLIRHDDSTILNSQQYPWALAVHDPNNAIIDASLYPNPATEKSIISFTNSKQEAIQWQLTDITGKQLRAGTAVCQPGKNMIYLQVSNIPNGLYFVNLSSPTERTSLKLQIIH